MNESPRFWIYLGILYLASALAGSIAVSFVIDGRISHVEAH